MKKIFLQIIRKLKLIKAADKIRFGIGLIKSYRHRKRFFRNNPTVKLPPPYYMYETFSLDYQSFYEKSKETAQWLVSHFKKYKKPENLNILDWGCGPGRVIRHLPALVQDSCRFYGTDYNAKYMKWCRENLPGITFKENKLQPPLNFEDNSMDIIYGISIFTHLSEEMHHAWFQELARVAKPGGVILLTLHGQAFSEKLTKEEKERFEQGKPVVKANTKEGHRTYAAFQPESFVRSMIGKNAILEHIPGRVINGRPQQDVWVFGV